MGFVIATMRSVPMTVCIVAATMCNVIATFYSVTMTMCNVVPTNCAVTMTIYAVTTAMCTVIATIGSVVVIRYSAGGVAAASGFIRPIFASSGGCDSLTTKPKPSFEPSVPGSG